MNTVSFARLRQLRDIAGTLGSRDLADALEELIHLRSSREIVTDDGAHITTACDLPVLPEDLAGAKQREPMSLPMYDCPECT